MTLLAFAFSGYLKPPPTTTAHPTNPQPAATTVANPSSSCCDTITIDSMNHQTQSCGLAQPQDDEKATLLIRHLPEAIPIDILSRLLSHYGSSTVRPCSGSRVRNSAFVDFNSKALASQAQQQLNGLRFLGKVLSVEQATKQVEDGSNLHNSTQMAKETAASSVKNAAAPNLLAQGSTFASEPIAQGLGVEYPFPPHLEYAYPPPDGNILTNIVNALIAVPRFYTQVLHLMNKMNIPAPFRAALPTPPLPNLVPAPPPVPPPSVPPPPHVFKGSTMGDTSSSESDMSSSDEDAAGKAEPKKKRIKREAILGPALNKDVAHEAVGLRPSALLPKEMPIIKKKNPVLQIKIAPKQIQNEQISVGDARQLEDMAEEVSRQERYATAEELKNGKLPPEELLSKPMFKSYAAGNPSPVLYIKNLAKDVVADDFYFIFGSFFGSIDAAKSSLSVKLMQEGRMRGQAFVTFPTIELAADALNVANGYVFKGKPIVIQFGRNQGN